MSNSDAKIAFVAYASKEPAVSKIIFDAVRRANSKPIPVRFEPWEFNDVPGTELVGPILGKISESPFVVADITTLNLNVVYEVGFAIGRGKRVFLIRHRETDGDKSLASEVGIFDTLGYHQYSTVDDLQARLTAHIDESGGLCEVGSDGSAVCVRPHISRIERSCGLFGAVMGIVDRWALL